MMAAKIMAAYLSNPDWNPQTSAASITELDNAIEARNLKFARWSVQAAYSISEAHNG